MGSESFPQRSMLVAMVKSLRRYLGRKNTTSLKQRSKKRLCQGANAMRQSHQVELRTVRPASAILFERLVVACHSCGAHAVALWANVNPFARTVVARPAFRSRVLRACLFCIRGLAET